MIVLLLVGPGHDSDPFSKDDAPYEMDGAVFVWGLISAGLMVLGAYGPWVTALGISVSGLDGTNDGWFVAGAAVLGALALLGRVNAEESASW